MKFDSHIEVRQPVPLIELLAKSTELSKTRLKECLKKGAVWIGKGGKKKTRIRRAKYILQSEDRISIYYDEAILAQECPEPDCLYKSKHYSIWNKPPLLLSQGTKYGDHCSLMRRAEILLSYNEHIHLVHRLDREAGGLMLLAHGRKGAAPLSELFRKREVEKRYRATVHGLLEQMPSARYITTPLDGKGAETIIKVTGVDRVRNRTEIDIGITTGRYHQIRRHLQSIGHPLIGDHRYGPADYSELLQLTAYQLKFISPFSNKVRKFQL